MTDFANSHVAHWANGQSTPTLPENATLLRWDSKTYAYDIDRESELTAFKEWAAFTFAGDDDPILMQGDDVDEYLDSIDVAVI